MSSRVQIREAVAGVLTARDELVVIHSSLFHLGLPPETLRWDMLALVRHLLAEGRTIAVPTFTFAFCGGADFGPNSPSEVGSFGDWMLTLPEVRRTPHPIYSFAVAGPLADELMACPNTTTFGDDSSFAYFEARNAAVVMLGCGWEYCTTFHRFEEQVEVPYRTFKTFTGNVDTGSGPRPADCTMFVRDFEVAAVNDFSPLERKLRTVGAIRTRHLGRGLIEAAHASDIAAVARELLLADELAFVEQPSAVAHRLRVRSDAPIRVAVLGGSNLELFRTAIADELSSLDPGRAVDTYLAPFGRHVQEVVDERSGLHAFEPVVTYFVDRLEDLARVDAVHEVDAGAIEELTTEYAGVIAQHARRNSGHVVVTTFAALTPSSVGIVDRANAVLRERLAGLTNLSMLDLAVEAARHGGPAGDPRLWFVGHIPFSPGLTRALARRILGTALAVTGRAARVVVVDLDNTIWGGVLGEDGIDGIALGGDHPGNAFAAFQRALRALVGRGIAIAVCSKNDEATAMDAIRHHPEMVLRETDFVATRIGWDPKPQGLVELAADLNLSLSNVLFVDDNPVERELVRAQLPAVRVLDLPPDPALYVDALLDSPYLTTVAITDEDVERVERLRVRADVERARLTFEHPEDFLRSLDMSLQLRRLGPGNLARAEQLMQKTNQFNTTTRRYSRAQLEDLAKGRNEVYVLRLQDRLSSAENIGVLVLRWDAPAPGEVEIDSLLLSCRVLGRGIEVAVLRWLESEVLRRNGRRIVGRVVPTERNTPVRTVFAENGFVPGSQDGEWIREVRDAPEPVHWLPVMGPEDVEVDA